MSSCDPATGCGPKTHNLHCSYPNCDKGRAAVKPAVVPVARYSLGLSPFGVEPVPCTVSDPGGNLVRHTDYVPVERVALAAREWAKAKTQAQGEWVEHGKVSAKTGVSLDKATDNLLTVVDAWHPS